MRPRCRALRRAGWALVQVDSKGDLVAAAYGPVPLDDAPFQQARDGEDYAIFMATALVEPPFALHIDCAGTLQCLSEAGCSATDADCERAHGLVTQLALPSLQ